MISFGPDPAGAFEVLRKRRILNKTIAALRLFLMKIRGVNFSEANETRRITPRETPAVVQPDA
jgi:hypothetical protein